MTWRSLRPFDCTTRMIICALSMSPALSSNDLADPQTAAVAERQHDVDLEIAGHGKEPLGLLRAHGERQLLRFLEVVDLGLQIESRPAA